MPIKKFLFAIWLLVSASASAQTWERVYPVTPSGTTTSCVDFNYNDNGAIIIGDNQNSSTLAITKFALKLNNKGDTMWTRYLFLDSLPSQQPLACTQLTGGNIVIALSDDLNTRVGLLKLSPTGSFISQKTHMVSLNPQYDMSLVPTPNNGYYFLYYIDSAASAYSIYTTVNSTYIEKYDSNDVRLWQNAVTFAHTDSFLNSATFSQNRADLNKAVLCSDGGIAYPIVWDTLIPQTGDYRYSLQKTKSNGAIDWTLDVQSLLNVSGSNYSTIVNSLVATSDSSLLVSISVVDTMYNYTEHLIKLNGHGVITDSISSSTIGALFDGVETSNGNYLFATGYNGTLGNYRYTFYDKHLHFLSCMPPLFSSMTTKLFKNKLGGAFSASNNVYNQEVLTTINFDSLFNTYPSSVSGTEVLDRNNNCATNSNDLAVKNSLIAMTDAQSNQWFAFTDEDGNYKVNVPDGSYTLSHSIHGYKAAECPATPALAYNITTPTQYSNVNLYDTLIPNKSDLAVSMYNFYFVPGFDNTLYLGLSNNGTVTGNTTLTFIKDPGVQFVSSTPAPSSVLGDTIRYTVNNLAADSMLNIVVNLHTPTTATAGQPLNFYASAPFANDLHPADNITTLADTILSSFDPNEKTVNRPLRYDPNTGELIYAVQFQNTGTYYAKNVVVTDTIDSHLDMSTFHLIGGTPFKPIISWWEGNKLLFTYTNIMLPDSTQNPKASIGSFAYGIKPKASVKVGDTIRNSADIYFDYNVAIVTNATMNIISKKPNTVQEVANPGEVTVYPNPSTGSFTVVLTGHAKDCMVKMMDMAGRAINCASTVNGNKIVLNTDAPNGIYLLQVTMPETKQVVVKKVTVIR